MGKQNNDARPTGGEQRKRTTVYVASIPGMTQWSDEYEPLAEWAGGEENVRLWDLTDRYACDGCGRHVTLMSNGYCGHCQDQAPELLTDGGRPQNGGEEQSPIEKIKRVADEIENESIGYTAEDRDSGGATMVDRDKMVSWMDDLRDAAEEVE